MQSITIELPDHVYQRLEEAAQASQAPLGTMVLRSIQAGLPPDLTHVPQRFHPDLRQMNTMSDSLLQQLLKTELSSQQVTRYKTLLDKNQTAILTESEQESLVNLREEADLLMFRRAYAAALLKWRGHNVSLPLLT